MKILTIFHYNVTIDSIMNDLLILALMLSEPKYGYQLKHEAGWITGQDTLHNNLVYPMLRRFLEQKWVSKKAVPGDRGQTRQQYALTAEGKRYLFDRLSEFSEADASSENAFNLRVGLFSVLKQGVRENVLDLRQAYLQQRNAKLGRLEEHMELGKFGGEIVRHMRKQIVMETDWIGHLRRIAASREVRK
jgi:DNA-binding PadR family transcriptional regulator